MWPCVYFVQLLCLFSILVTDCVEKVPEKPWIFGKARQNSIFCSKIAGNLRIRYFAQRIASKFGLWLPFELEKGHVTCVVLRDLNPHCHWATVKRDSQKLFCDATRDATGAKPGKPQIAAMSHPTQLPQLGHRRPSQKLSLAQLLRCDAMRQAIWCTILTFSTAKLYKGARVAYKFLQVVSNRANLEKRSCQLFYYWILCSHGAT